MTLIPKKLTFEDFAALFFGTALWLIYLYPVWKTGAFCHPIDWPTMVLTVKEFRFRPVANGFSSTLIAF